MLSLEEARRLCHALTQGFSQREARLRELSRWICPSRGIFTRRNEDSPKRPDMLRFTQPAAQAVLRGASGMTSGITPSGTPWFRPGFTNPELEELSQARPWLDQVDRTMKDCLGGGGFYQAIQSFNTDLIWAGSALLYSEASAINALRYECIQQGTWAVATDREGQLQSVCRSLCLGATDVLPIAGEEARLSPGTRRLLKMHSTEKIGVWHLSLTDTDGPYPVESCWWEEGGKEFLSQSGYEEMPFFFTVWHEGATVYGTGPGDEALPDAMQMDLLERRKLEGLAKIISPPVSAPTQLKGYVDLSPGAINFTPDRSLISPILDLGSFAMSLPHIRQEIETVQARLNRSLMADIFTSMPLDQRPAGMSATEFLERKREALQQLGPVISAYEPNVLTPLLFRTLQALNRMGSLPPIPDALRQYDLDVKIDFISPSSNALRQTGAETTRALFMDVAQMVQASGDASVLDKIDMDQMVDELASGLGCPGKIVRADAEVEALRQQRAQAQQQAQAMQMQAQQLANMQGQAQALMAQANAAKAMNEAGQDAPDDGAINVLGELGLEA